MVFLQNIVWLSLDYLKSFKLLHKFCSVVKILLFDMSNCGFQQLWTK
jgi:hypothetical protein